ncbi:MAG: DUF86 domain-containing protein [Saprospiraceae bacterium]|nr:DUF86 domain-containing protein [Saprospiraceae bacterium]
MPDKLGDKVRLQHILFAIEEIESYIADADFDIFVSNSMMFNATLRQLEIIGEAANRLSENVLQNNVDIPWARIIGLRNLVIHEYFGIDDITIWNIVKINIPDLKSKIKLLIEEAS